MFAVNLSLYFIQADTYRLLDKVHGGSFCFLQTFWVCFVFFLQVTPGHFQPLPLAITNRQIHYRAGKTHMKTHTCILMPGVNLHALRWPPVVRFCRIHITSRSQWSCFSAHLDAPWRGLGFLHLYDEGFLYTARLLQSYKIITSHSVRQSWVRRQE